LTINPERIGDLENSASDKEDKEMSSFSKERPLDKKHTSSKWSVPKKIPSASLDEQSQVISPMKQGGSSQFSSLARKDSLKSLGHEKHVSHKPQQTSFNTKKSKEDVHSPSVPISERLPESKSSNPMNEDISLDEPLDKDNFEADMHEDISIQGPKHAEMKGSLDVTPRQSVPASTSRFQAVSVPQQTGGVGPSGQSKASIDNAGSPKQYSEDFQSVDVKEKEEDF